MKKQNSIKILSVAFAAAMALSAQTLVGLADNSLKHEQSYTLEKLVEIPIGKGEGQVTRGYTELGDPGMEPRDPDKGDGGPGSFAVAPNGDVFVVDSYRDYSPIIQYSAKGEYIRTITSDVFATSEFSKDGVSSVMMHGEKMYVVDYDAGNTKSFFEYDIETGKATCIETPESHVDLIDNAMFRLNIGDYIVIRPLNFNDEVWMFDTVNSKFEKARDEIYSQSYDEKTGTVTFNIAGEKISLKSGNNPMFEGYAIPLGFDKEGNIIVVRDYSYRKYTKDGEVIAYVQKPIEGEYLSLGQDVLLVDGEMIMAICDENNYYTNKVVFSDTYFTEYPMDLNFDKKENTGDAALLLMYCAKSMRFDGALIAKADVNNDGKTNTGDVATILLKCAK